MASVDDTCSDTSKDLNNISDDFKLNENDVPGAALVKPPEHCTVAILKRWLACRGAKVSGKRDDLIKRVNDYTNNGLANNIVDPDGGVNILKKRISLGIEEELSPLTDETFPVEGFKVGIPELPKIGYSQIWKYLIEDVEFKKQLSIEKPIVKGYNFFKSGKVLGIYTKAENNLFYIKSKVMPSYSKSGPVHGVRIIVNSNSDICKAYCSCPAGVDGRCNHLAATLFAIEDMCQPDSVTRADGIACTSKPCKWSVPRKRQIESAPIQTLKFEKHVWGKKKANYKTSETQQDVRAPHQRNQDQDLNAIFERAKEVEKKTGKKMGLTYIMPHSLPAQATVQETKLVEEPQKSKWDIVSPMKNCPLSLDDIAERALRTKQRLFDSATDAKAISEDTCEQHKTRVWYDVRQPRITASKCKRCLLKPTTSPTKAIAEVLSYNPAFQTKAMKEGIEWEPKILKQFEKETGHEVRKSGFLISQSHPFLGASPDGITEENHLVEIKKIVLKDDELLKDAVCRLGIFKKYGTELVINKSHQYFYQIQQQLFCSKQTVCHFVVSNGVEIYTDLILFDSSFWNEVLPKLEQFYFENIFPEIVYPRILHGNVRWNKLLPFPRSS